MCGNAITIMSALCCDVIIFGLNFPLIVKLFIRMVRVENYETVSKFVKVMQRKLSNLFFPETVYVT